MLYTSVFYLLSSLSIVALIWLFSERIFKRRMRNNGGAQRYSVGTHVIISGGSKGIGKSIAKKFAELGTHVTIIARKESDLEAAKREIEKYRRAPHIQKIRTLSLDLTKVTFPNNSNSDISNQQQELLEKILGEHERCDILVNCCGSAIAARFEDISQQQFNYLMDVNYFSAVNLTRVLLPVMKARSLSNQNGSRSNGNARIVFVSSMCGLMSFFGYSAYSASKFALVGLAETLHMELKPFDIGVTIAFPPDTDTPGFEEENKTKPSLTSKISETGNVYSPDEVACSIVNDVRAKKFSSTVGIENILVLKAMNSFMPGQSICSLIIDSLLAGPLKLAAYFIMRSWYNLVKEAAPNEIIKAGIALKCSKNSKCDEATRST